MRVSLKALLVVAASLTACAAVTTSWSLAVAQEAGLSQANLQELETLLKELGFDPGEIDGVVDDATVSAIKQYQEFASLPGDPVPSESLLSELRGVAAAFAALRNDPLPDAAASEVPAPAPSGAPAEEAPESAAPTAGPADSAPSPATPPDTGPGSSAADTGFADPADKVIVPPPPAPPKLKPLDAIPKGGDAPAQLAARPSEEEATAQAAPAEAAVPVDPRQARIDAALEPYRKDLANGKVSREALARRFNNEGRLLLQAAQYEAAIGKFDVAIHLSPRFAGAYSNRGTAYELQSESERAASDFERARELGFGGVRPQKRANPIR